MGTQDAGGSGYISLGGKPFPDEDEGPYPGNGACACCLGSFGPRLAIPGSMPCNGKGPGLTIVIGGTPGRLSLRFELSLETWAGGGCSGPIWDRGSAPL